MRGAKPRTGGSRGSPPWKNTAGPSEADKVGEKGRAASLPRRLDSNQ